MPGETIVVTSGEQTPAVETPIVVLETPTESSSESAAVLTTTIDSVERIVKLEECVARLESSMMNYQSEISQVRSQVETMARENEEVEAVAVVVPDPLPEPAVKPPTKARHPLAMLLLGRSVSDR